MGASGGSSSLSAQDPNRKHTITSTFVEKIPIHTRMDHTHDGMVEIVLPRDIIKAQHLPHLESGVRCNRYPKSERDNVRTDVNVHSTIDCDIDVPNALVLQHRHGLFSVVAGFIKFQMGIKSGEFSSRYAFSSGSGVGDHPSVR